MAMPAQPTEWTVDMVRALPDDGNRYEVIDGELFVTPSPSWTHQRAVLELALLIAPYVRDHRIGEAVISPADVIVYGPRKFVQPEGGENAGEFDTEAFRRAVELTIIGQEIIVGNAKYPTEKIRDNSHRFRPLGLVIASQPDWPTRSMFVAYAPTALIFLGGVFVPIQFGTAKSQRSSGWYAV